MHWQHTPLTKTNAATRPTTCRSNSCGYPKNADHTGTGSGGALALEAGDHRRATSASNSACSDGRARFR